MNLRLATMAAGLLLATALPAKAAIVDNFGPDPTSAAGAFSNDPNGPLVGGLFYDQYLFSLIGPAYVTVVTASNTFATGGIGGPFGITGFAGAIYEIVGAVDPFPGGDDILRFGPTFATLCASSLCQEMEGVGLLLGGDYYLAVTGNAGALAGYGGNLSVAEVPLPGAAWLFGTVLAAVYGGKKLRDRRRKYATA